MRLHRFYITEKVGEQTEITLSDTDLIHQIGNVFRLREGDEVIIFDGSGFEYVTQIVSLSKKELILKIKSKTQNEVGGVKPKTSLYLAIIKKGNFELAVEKCTEVGVDKIIPVVSERSEKKDINMERLHKIVKEASEQCGRMTLPEISEVLSLEEAVMKAKKENETCIAFHTSISDSSDRPGYQNNHPALSKAGIDGGYATFVGPEGGWTEKEITLFKEHNFELCSLGQNILRAETAAIISVFQATQKLSR